MAENFWYSAKAIPLTLLQIARLSDEEAHLKLAELRWGSGGFQVCPTCGALEQHHYIKSRKQWRCKHCDATFSVTSSSPFANCKLGYSKLLMGLFCFLIQHKGKAALELRRSIGGTYRTSYLFNQKIREAITRTVDQTPLSGVIEIDGAHFSGRIRKGRKKRPTARQRGELEVPKKWGVPSGQHRTKVPYWAYPNNKNRRIVIVLRQISQETTGAYNKYTDKPIGKGAERTVVAVCESENAQDIQMLVRKYVEPGSLIRTDELSAYGNLKYMGYRHEVVNHSKEFSTDEGVNENQAESFFGRARRSVIGIYHRVTPHYMVEYMHEMAWREDVRRMDTREQLENLVARVFNAGPSKLWVNYGQNKRKKKRLESLQSQGLQASYAPAQTHSCS